MSNAYYDQSFGERQVFATYPVLSGIDVLMVAWWFLDFSGGVPEAFEDWEETDSSLPTDVSSLPKAGLSEDGETVRAREQEARIRKNYKEENNVQMTKRKWEWIRHILRERDRERKCVQMRTIYEINSDC